MEKSGKTTIYEYTSVGGRELHPGYRPYTVRDMDNIEKRRDVLAVQGDKNVLSFLLVRGEERQVVDVASMAELAERVDGLVGQAGATVVIM